MTHAGPLAPASAVAKGALDGLVLAVVTAGSGFVSLALGQDVNFDQLHYHVYLGWSLLADRLGQDVAPALLGSYLNPVPHVPSYLGLAHLPPRLFGFALGAVHGLNAYLVYRLAVHVLRGRTAARRHAALAGVVAVSGPSAVSLLGTTFGDNLISLLVLAAFLLAVHAADGQTRSAPTALFWAGVLGGSAVGLKLTFGPFALGLAAASIAVAACCHRWAAAVAFAGGSALGALLGGGYWAWQMWSRFSNPIFPFANPVFPAPFDGATILTPDSRWASQGWVDVLAVPFEMALGLTGRLQEVPFRDARCLLALVLIGVALVAASRLLRMHAAFRRSPSAARLGDRFALSRATLVLVVGWLTAYVAWVRVFHYYRYFAAGELLAPVVVLALLAVLAPARFRVLWPLVAVTMLVSSATGSWGRMPWRDQPLTVRYEAGARSTGPAAVIVDGPGLSYVLPFLPPGSRFFGIGTGNPIPREARRSRGREPPRTFPVDPQQSVPSDLRWLGLSDTGSVVSACKPRTRSSFCRSLAR
jgi:hypothetical protein